ncbi:MULTISPECIES: NFACT RNA binding domain-containing protein [Emticicia]|uniref:NFACT RNA binding domain-containing protein n=1 Tax=Emticicia TaxID=312278 RepID=UPI0007D8A793|nr:MULTISPECIES: NFACT RNA binding domain-containing protein [Emticicia]
MHNNYYFLRKLTKQLASKIIGLKLMECFSQEKDELVLGFAAARGKNRNYKEFFIKAIVFPDFSCLYFTDKFERARRNSVDLFEQLIDLEVTGVRQFKNERCFAITFENGFSLAFRMYGTRSNLILFHENEVLELFHSRIVSDKNLIYNQLDREIEQTYERFLSEKQDYRKLYPTLGKIVNDQLTLGKTTWEELQTFVQQLEHPRYYLVRWEHALHLSLLPVGEIIEEFSEPIEAMNAFYIAYNKVNTLDDEKAEVLRRLSKEKKQTEAYLQNSYQRMESLDSEVKNEEIGHILMANLHQIEERAERVELFDFYRNQNIVIKLRGDLSPQKNAENFYRKAKNEKIEIEKLIENIESREALLETINRHIENIEQSENLKNLRSYLKANGLSPNSKLKIQSYRELFKRFEVDGFEILVGKNSKNNDLLTQQYAYKEDLWLHARDATGSHVVLKYRAGKKFPNAVIEKAASLAAYFSKRRNETLAPVIVTPKKFVRKPKGFAEGQVLVDKEEVVMVEPKLP